MPHTHMYSTRGRLYMYSTIVATMMTTVLAYLIMITENPSTQGPHEPVTPQMV